MPKASRKWDSLADFIDACEGPAADGRADYLRSSRRHGDDFTGTDSYADAEQIAFNWAEGVERVNRIRARIALRNQRVRKEVVAREAGPGVLNMGKYLMGHPQPYMNLEDGNRVAKGRGKVVRIVLNCSVSSGVSTEVILTRGAAILALCDALEQSGKRVEIQVVNFAQVTAYNSYDYRVTVKRAERKLNLNSVVFAIAHPSFLRRFVFAAKERETAFRFTAMGKPADFMETVPENTIYLKGGGMQPEWRSEEAAAAWVRESLEAQGVRIK